MKIKASTIRTTAKITTVAAISTLGAAGALSNAYAQTANQAQSADLSWMWWLLPLAALVILFFILRRSLQVQRDDFEERFQFDDQPLAGVKGGQVKRDRADDEVVVDDAAEDANHPKNNDPWDRTKDDWNV